MIRFEDVTLSYDKNHAPALDAVSFDIERGEFVFLVGQSGSGKSSLMRLMTHEVTPSSGSIHIAGRDLTNLPRRKVPALRRDIGVVFQDFRLLENKTVAENVAFVLEILGRRRSSIRTAVPEALELVGLAEKSRRFPHELSGGEQQRVAIARAVVKQPAILLADEPTGNLDPENSDEVVGVLDRINRTSTTLVMATHDNSLVDRLQRRVIEMSDGRLVRDSTGGYRSGATTADAGLPLTGAQQETVTVRDPSDATRSNGDASDAIAQQDEPQTSVETLDGGHEPSGDAAPATVPSRRRRSEMMRRDRGRDRTSEGRR